MASRSFWAGDCFMFAVVRISIRPWDFSRTLFQPDGIQLPVPVEFERHCWSTMSDPERNTGTECEGSRLLAPTGTPQDAARVFEIGEPIVRRVRRVRRVPVPSISAIDQSCTCSCVLAERRGSAGQGWMQVGWPEQLARAADHAPSRHALHAHFHATDRTHAHV
jgi:hypothetical protein